MRTLILEPKNYSRFAHELYKKLGPVRHAKAANDDHSDITLLVVRLSTQLDEAYLSTYPTLKAIASPTTGLTHIDTRYCDKKGIRIFSLLDCRQAIEKVTSTSELTVGLIISLLRSIPKAHIDVVLNGSWDRDRFRSRQLSGMTLGIIGLGRIGGHLAGYAKAFGMNVVAYDPFISATRFTDCSVTQLDLDKVLELADIVSINANLREDNQNLIGAEQIEGMKPGALLVNTARGALLDEDAVVKALRQGHLGGVAVDVLSQEQDEKLRKQSPLVCAAKEGLDVIVVPHIGGCTSDAMHITEECLAEYVVNAMGVDNE